MPVLGNSGGGGGSRPSGRDRASEVLSASVGYSGGMNIMEDTNGSESYV